MIDPLNENFSAGLFASELFVYLTSLEIGNTLNSIGFMTKIIHFSWGCCDNFEIF